MVDIVVKREKAVPYKHEDIVEEILGTSVPAAVERGRSVLDEEGTGGQNLIYEVSYRIGLRLGQLVKLNDSFLGEELFAKIVGISHQATKDGNGGLTLITQLTVRRSTFFYSESLP